MVSSFFLQQPERQIVKVSLTSCRPARTHTHMRAYTYASSTRQSRFGFGSKVRVTPLVSLQSSFLLLLLHTLLSPICVPVKLRKNRDSIFFFFFSSSLSRETSFRIYRIFSLHYEHLWKSSNALCFTRTLIIVSWVACCLLIPQVALTESGNWQEISPEVIILLVTRYLFFFFPPLPLFSCSFNVVSNFSLLNLLFTSRK